MVDTPSDKKKRLIKNTLMLYIRTFVSMIISLYSVRIVLDALGVEDYGIQNVVSGFVSMFSFVTGSFSIAISRFMSIEIEHDNRQQLAKIFSSSMQIMFIASLLMAIIIEAFGVWLLNSEMNISEDRMVAANWVLQFSILTLIFSLISVPFDALIISHEKMSAFAYISIFGNILKLIIAFLIYYSPIDDALIYYALLLLLQSIIIRLCYGTYCSRHFNDVKFCWTFDKSLVKRITALTGWSSWGSASLLLSDHGVNIILNIFFGPAINAARGIAMQINTAVNQFSGGFQTALRPQIFKTYASGDKQALWMMVNSGVKFSCFMILLISIPIIVECHYILKLWLGDIPEHTINFVILVIIFSLSGNLTYTHNTTLIAIGNIKTVQFTTGIIQLCNVPLSYTFLYLGMSPESTFVISIILSQVCCFVKIGILHAYTGYSITKYMVHIYLRVIITGLIIVLPIFYLKNIMAESLLRMIITTIVSFIWGAITIIFVGCNKMERKFIIEKIYNRLNPK